MTGKLNNFELRSVAAPKRSGCTRDSSDVFVEFTALLYTAYFQKKQRNEKLVVKGNANGIFRIGKCNVRFLKTDSNEKRRRESQNKEFKTFHFSRDRVTLLLLHYNIPTPK